MYRIDDMPVEQQMAVLWLHKEAFDNAPCAACKGKCCDSCALAHGYLRGADFQEAKAKYGFDEKKGFLTDKGCSLPIDKRSTTCIGFSCWLPPKDAGDWTPEAKAAQVDLYTAIYEHAVPDGIR